MLSQVRGLGPLRYRCQVGHGYTAQALDAVQQTGLDEAIRVALRIVEERAVLSERMAGWRARRGASFRMSRAAIGS